MTIFSLILSLLMVLGFHFIGNKLLNLFKLKAVISQISDPIYQYALIGISFFIFTLYPIFFLQIYNSFFFQFVSYSIVVCGLVFCIINLSKFKNALYLIINKFRTRDIKEILIFFLITCYFLLSISPVTSGDSVSYHMGSAKYILEYGHFSKDLLYTEAALVGAGEFLNAFALSIKALQFTSLINFIGIISIFGVIKKFSARNFLPKDNKNFLILCFLSCPVLVFLVSSSKSQLFATALIFISYSILILNIYYYDKKEILKQSSYFLIILPIVAVQTKLSFSVSLFIIIMVYFFTFFKKINVLKFIILLSLLFVIGLLPQTLWKQEIYEYPFYNFLINPYPINLPGFYEAFLNAKNYFANKFPFILLVPLSPSDLTQFIGLGILTTFVLLKKDYKNKNITLFIIIFFLLVYTVSGQKAARFYLEIYLFIILVSIFVIKKIRKSKFFKILSVGIILQSVFLICVQSYGIYNLLPGSFSYKLNQKVLSKYASGYNLYDWANKVLPDDAIALIKHRSFYFAKKNLVYVGMTGYFDNLSLDKKKFFVKKIKEKKPNYIIFYGTKNHFNYDGFNFKDCTRGIFSKKIDVGFEETRNPFNKGKKFYNAYIYNLDSEKLEKCIKFN